MQTLKYNFPKSHTTLIHMKLIHLLNNLMQLNSCRIQQTNIQVTPTHGRKSVLNTHTHTGAIKVRTNKLRQNNNLKRILQQEHAIRCKFRQKYRQLGFFCIHAASAGNTATSSVTQRWLRCSPAALHQALPGQRAAPPPAEFESRWLPNKEPPKRTTDTSWSDNFILWVTYI